MSRSSEVLGRLLLEHIGRKSGARRYAVLEVVDHPRADEYVIVSGFGEQSQWYRNVVAKPHVRVSVGLRCNAPALATPDLALPMVRLELAR
jgi:deazaflavin-dependent oxidoreductase (nitroreductase family)